MQMEASGPYRVFLPASLLAEPRGRKLVGGAAAFLVTAVCFLVATFAGFLATVFLDAALLVTAVCLGAATFEPGALVFDDDPTAGDFGPWVFLAAVACLDAVLRPLLLPTTLRTPGPGIRLDSSPESQRTVRSWSCVAVTTPTRRPAFKDATSIRSPTSGIPITS